MTDTPARGCSHSWEAIEVVGEPAPVLYLCRHCRVSLPPARDGLTSAAPSVGTLLAERAAHAKAALDKWIVQQREAGRSFRDIAAEVGMTPGGVQYVTRKDA